MLQVYMTTSQNASRKLALTTPQSEEDALISLGRSASGH